MNPFLKPGDAILYLFRQAKWTKTLLSFIIHILFIVKTFWYTGKNEKLFFLGAWTFVVISTAYLEVATHF